MLKSSTYSLLSLDVLLAFLRLSPSETAFWGKKGVERTDELAREFN